MVCPSEQLLLFSRIEIGAHINLDEQEGLPSDIRYRRPGHLITSSLNIGLLLFKILTHNPTGHRISSISAQQFNKTTHGTGQKSSIIPLTMIRTGMPIFLLGYLVRVSPGTYQAALLLQNAEENTQLELILSTVFAHTSKIAGDEELRTN